MGVLKSLRFGLAFLVVATLFISVVFFISLKSNARATSGDNLSGYAWSSTIGWLSFNCTDPGTCGSGLGQANYGVRVAANGALSGYAWSPNIGWVSFNSSDVAGCPTGNCPPVFNRNNGEVSGWAIALAGVGRLDGWDGWINLRGSAIDSSAYGVLVNNCAWTGFAWGGPVVGWLSFGGASYGVLGTGDACAGPPPPECSDGINNDPWEDSLIDLNDPGCSSPTDNSEVDPLKQCQNGFDDSDPEDTLADAADPGCYDYSVDPPVYAPTDDNEIDPFPVCSNKFDDDGDGLKDALDPGCWDDPKDPYIDAENPGSYNPNRTSERRVRFIELLPQ